MWNGFLSFGTVRYVSLMSRFLLSRTAFNSSNCVFMPSTFFPRLFFRIFSWVVRSADNLRLKPLWPYFSSAYDVERLRKDLPVEVNSCWNGLTAFDAKWFYANYSRSASTPATLTDRNSSSISQSITSTFGDTQNNYLETSRTSILVHGDEGVGASSSLKKRKTSTKSNSTALELSPLPLTFRTSELCPSSESLLISYDLHRALKPTGRRPKILINPKVKVGE